MQISNRHITRAENPAASHQPATKRANAAAQAVAACDAWVADACPDGGGEGHAAGARLARRAGGGETVRGKGGRMWSHCSRPDQAATLAAGWFADATDSVVENDRSTLGIGVFCSESASKWKNLRIVSIPGFVVSPLRIFHRVVNGTPDAVEIAMSAALFSGSSRSLTRAADGICEFMATSYRIRMTIATVFGRCPRYA